MEGVLDQEKADWRSLYTAGGLAAVMMILLIIAQTCVFVVSGTPGDASASFALFQRSPLLGLLSFELLMIAYVILSLPVAFALCAALGHSAPSLTASYLVLTIVGVAAWITARPAFEMLHLSKLHQTAANDLQRAAFVAAGEGLVATFHGTAFYVSYILGSVGGLIISIAMWRTQIFGKATAVLRIASSVLDLGLFLPEIGLTLSLVSVFALLGWDVLVARRLFQLASGDFTAETRRHVGCTAEARGIPQ
jgi:hypothetical protein